MVSSIAGLTHTRDHSASPEVPKGRGPVVLQVVPRLDTGGVERGTLEMVEAVVAAGGRALVASAGGTLAGRVARLGGTLYPMNLASKNPFTLWQNAGLLARLVREEGVAVIHARSRAPAWSAWLAAQRTGVAFITTYHGVYRENLPLKRAYNAVMARGRPTIAVSTYVRDLVALRHGLAAEHLITIPRGADLRVFSEDAVGDARTVGLAEAWGLVDDPRPVVMLAGRLSHWKGQAVLIEAAAALARQGIEALFLIVGDGRERYRRALEARISALALEASVRLVGGCQDMAAAYKLASVAVSASTEPEAFGRVAIEAQAMARPVIATDHGGARETVAPGETGWLVPPGDADALAAALAEALALSPEARQRIGAAGRARVEGAFSLERMQQATLAVYAQATGQRFPGLPALDT
ncbi:MAG: glycosyltransferase family 4 protein [Pseudomonadota bacterium]